MKKLALLSTLCGLGFVGAASAANITIYYSPTCPHCHNARQFIEGTLVYEYPTVTVQTVNVTDSANSEMFRTVLEKCEYTSGGVPVMTIDDKCFQGYADFMQQELRDAVEASMSDDDKATAAANREAMTADADAFKSEHADRANAVSEYSAAAAAAEQAQAAAKKNSGSGVWFYGLLVALVAALGFVLIKKDNKKK